MSELKMAEEEYFKKKGKYSIPERRRCPDCHTKSYSKFIGKIEISAYHCGKCQNIFYILVAPLEFEEIPRSLQSQLTVDDLRLFLESVFYRGPMTRKRWNERMKEIQKELKMEKESRPLSIREQMEIILNEFSLMEDTDGVELNLLLKALKAKHNIDANIALRLIKQLMKENLIYEPKKGYFKRKN